MSPEAKDKKDSDEKLIEDALRLPPEARGALAGMLLESLDGPVDAEAEPAWAKEIERRFDELDQGVVRQVP